MNKQIIEELKENPRNLKVEEVAKILGVSRDTIRKGIIDKVLDFGVCIVNKRNTFIIPSSRFIAWYELKTVS